MSISVGGSLAEINVSSEMEFRRERAMEQYHRHPRRHHKHSHGAPFTRRARGQRNVTPTLVS